MAICVAVGCKIYGTKIWNNNNSYKQNVKISSQYNISECVMLMLGQKFLLEKDAIWACPKRDLLLHPTTPHPSTIQAPSKNKN